MPLSKLLLDRSVKMLVCDMAGTTVNEKGLVYKTLYRTIRDVGINIREKDIDKWHGANKYEVIDHFLKQTYESPDYIDTLAPILYRKFDDTLAYKYSIPGNVSLISHGLPSLYTTFRHSGIKICLNTGYSKDIQESIIFSLKMDEFIDDYISSGDVNYGRPDPEMIHTLMKRNGVDHSSMVVKVGDTPNDIYEGINANCLKSVGVLSGADNEQTLMTAGATDIINSVMDIEFST